MDSQNEMILEHLKSGRAIDPHRALQLFGCFRLGARIWDLRRQGYQIKSELKNVKNRRGVECRIAVYRMGE